MGRSNRREVNRRKTPLSNLDRFSKLIPSLSVLRRGGQLIFIWAFSSILINEIAVQIFPADSYATEGSPNYTSIQSVIPSFIGASAYIGGQKGTSVWVDGWRTELRYGKGKSQNKVFKVLITTNKLPTWKTKPYLQFIRFSIGFSRCSLHRSCHWQ